MKVIDYGVGPTYRPTCILYVALTLNLIMHYCACDHRPYRLYSHLPRIDRQYKTCKSLPSLAIRLR